MSSIVVEEEIKNMKLLNLSQEGFPLPLDLPTDLFLHHVLIYFDVSTLLHVTSINKTFHSIGRDDMLWERHCDVQWNHGNKYGLKGKPLRIYHDIAISQKAWKRCKISHLKLVLKDKSNNTNRLTIKMRRFLEKQEFIDAIIRTQSGKIMVFEYKWFSSYFYALRYGHKQVPDMEDVCSCKWIMQFKAEMRERMQANGNRVPTIVGEFFRNYEYKSTPQFSNQDLMWRFVQADGVTAVQIAQYPPLIFSRISDYCK